MSLQHFTIKGIPFSSQNSKEKRLYFFLILFFSTCNYSLQAEDSTFTTITSPILSLNSLYALNQYNYNELGFTPDSSDLNLLLPPDAPELLPDNISFMENFLWGEDGLVRKVGIASPLTPDVRKHELGVRRVMLTAHQIGGFVTLGSMITAAYFGQRSIDKSIRDYGSLHRTFVLTTIISYSATALLAVLSPPPLIRRDEISTTTIHKTLAWVHVIGMIVTPILGSLITQNRHYDSKKAHFHQVAGYITTAVFAASMIVVTF